MVYEISFPREFNKYTLNDTFSQYNRVVNGNFEEIVFDLSKSRFIRPTGIVTIIAMIQYLKCIKSHPQISLIHPRRNKLRHYLNRINFYNLVGIDTEEIVRRSSRGRFFEVTNVKSHTEVRGVSEELADIFMKQTRSSEDLSGNINSSLSEILDNIFHHSYSPISGVVCAQTFSQKREAEFAICDAGIGIKESLKNNPEYSDLTSDMKAIKKALEKEVTGTIGENAVGLNNTGEGLYYIKEAIISNSGDFHIYSRKGKMSIEQGNIEYSRCPLWPGTLISITINLDNDFPLYDNLDSEIEGAEGFGMFDF